MSCDVVCQTVCLGPILARTYASDGITHMHKKQVVYKAYTK